MIREVFIADGVREEIESVALWIEEQRAGYGGKFMDAYDAAIDHLFLFPLSQKIKYKHYREIRLGRFSYVLIYEVYENEIWVLRVIHTSQDPAKRYAKRGL